MDGRIGSLEVRYHTPGLDPKLAAGLPALTRALELQLADALDADLTDAIGDGRDVYVVRELSVDTELDAGWMLDRPVVERMSRAAVEAVSAALARPSDDVKHFADQAEFLCAFIVDELDGAAADRWYFGAFAPYRRADGAATIEAVLAAHPGHVAATLGHLARHGRLDALLKTLGARRILAALDASAAASPATGVGVLVDAALQLAGLGGWTIDGGHRQTIRQALLARHRDAVPAWQDRRLMSAFVWACVEDVAEMLRARGVTRADGDRGALVRALHGDLDWLDAPWLLARLDAAGAGTDDGRTSAPPNRLAIVLTRIATAVADGRVSCAESDDDDALVVRLVAAAQLRAEEHVSIDALRAALRGAVREWRALLAKFPLGTGPDRAAAAARRPVPPSHPGGGVPSAEALRPDAAVKALTRALVERSAAASAGEPTRGAGRYPLWLDAPWLLARLDAAGAGTDDRPSPAPNRLAIVLTHIATAVADGRVSCAESDDDDALVVRLVAAAQLRAEEHVSIDALRAALRGAVREWRALLAKFPLGTGPERAAAAARRPVPPSPPGGDVPSAEPLTPAAAVKALTRALAERSAAAASEGEPTRGAGLYLLSRVVLDAGLPGLAATHGVPLSPLLAQLAVRWLDLEWPLDQPAHDWTGAGNRDETSLDRLETAAGLAALADALRDRLLAQGVLASAADGEVGGPLADAESSAVLDAIAAWLLRAWARWLPGLREASAGFLRAQCLARGGAVRRSATRIDVTLDPAPLDVVLQMAGYLRPIEALAWCGDRAVTFVVRRQPSA